MGVSLRIYRYAWAEEAKSAGYPERYAQANFNLQRQGHDAGVFAQGKGGNAVELSEYERMRMKFMKCRRA